MVVLIRDGIFESRNRTTHEVFVAPLPVGCHMTVLFHCCHSGSALDFYNTAYKIKEPNRLLDAGQGLMCTRRTRLRIWARCSGAPRASSMPCKANVSLKHHCAFGWRFMPTLARTSLIGLLHQPAGSLEYLIPFSPEIPVLQESEVHNLIAIARGTS